MRPGPSGTGMRHRAGPKAAAVLGLLGLLLGLAGCRISSGPRAAPGATLTEPLTPSALVTVVSGTQPGGAPGSGGSAAGLGRALAWLTAVTARPGEDFDLLRAGARPTVLAAAGAPPPARVSVPGKPSGPGPGATSFQQATFHHQLQHWQGAVATANREVAARTHAALASWASGLRLPARLSGLPRAGGPAGTLSAECAVAASTLGGLEAAAGNRFGARHVVLLYPASLAGAPPSGELTGDDVIVVTPFLPSAAATTAAQASLLAAGAAQASILGPQTTAAQLAQLVSAGLDQQVATETLSGPALFGNDSAVLLPGAVRLLTPLLAPLRKPGAIGVINGYASTPGSAATNYQLSYARAAAVAGFLEAHGVPASSLVAVGHGASNLVAPGAAGANRRVVVVIEGPPSAGL